jgi:hypothetical protein
MMLRNSGEYNIQNVTGIKAKVCMIIIRSLQPQLLTFVEPSFYLIATAFYALVGYHKMYVKRRHHGRPTGIPNG